MRVKALLHRLHHNHYRHCSAEFEFKDMHYFDGNNEL